MRYSAKCEEFTRRTKEKKKKQEKKYQKKEKSEKSKEEPKTAAVAQEVKPVSVSSKSSVNRPVASLGTSAEIESLQKLLLAKEKEIGGLKRHIDKQDKKLDEQTKQNHPLKILFDKYEVKSKIICITAEYENRLSEGKRHIIHLEAYINNIINLLNNDLECLKY